jgi:hypothetical protein
VSISVITVGGQSVNLVAMPSTPGMRTVEFEMDDAVGIVTSTFTGQVQAQQWPGADMLRGTMTLPVLVEANADRWKSFLAELRGMANAFQIGDPLKSTPAGTGAGTPTANGAQAAGSQTLAMTGFTGTGALLPGDYVQIGYRLYMVLEQQDSATASVGIWPSLREALAGGETIITQNTVGLFRLATNKRGWSVDVTRLSQMSFKIQEYR